MKSALCSFCHKNQEAVGKLISSPPGFPRVYICDECVMVCSSILEDVKDETPGEPETQTQQLRQSVALLLDYVADRDLETVEKILHALGDPERRGPGKMRDGEVLPFSASEETRPGPPE